jgi:Phage integrase, N-terminal SAM-like domain
MTKQISPLRQRMIDDMAFRNMSPNTQKVYAYAVANFSRFDRQSPDKLGLEHVRE